ncbi:MAG: DUF4959 domain-containing protein [Paludibacter sp.]|nr:DUF4959 domain-containing protein [Paludibacter sp.]
MIHINKFSIKINAFIVSILAILFFAACNGNEINEDVTPPDIVTNISYRATSGGAVLYFTAPADDDLLYVKASYRNSLGNDVFKVSSRYCDSIEIDGFVDELPHEITLTAIDNNKNESESVKLSVTPLKSYIYAIRDSMTLAVDFGGVRLKWNERFNPNGKQVFIYLYYENGSKIEERILSSADTTGNIPVFGLDSIPYNFYAAVEDFNGNKTDTVGKGTYKPLFEQTIDKSTWTVLQSLSVDGDKYEGSLKAFFDDEIDTKNSNTDNSYFIIDRADNGGQLNFPLNIVIDLNKSVVINRFKVWQRAFWYLNDDQNGVSDDYYYYQESNMRSFEIYVSNDLISWTDLGSFDIGDPKDSEGNVPVAKIQEAIDGHEFVLESASPAFRYLKFAILSNYGSEIYVYGSEITLYGLDNQ